MVEHEYDKTGLKPQHHGELNVPECVFKGGKETKAARIAVLRQEYADNPKALQQIDIYEGNNEYGRNIHLYVEALKSGDRVKEIELYAWFKKHYPDVI